MFKQYSRYIILILIITPLCACSSLDYFSHLTKGQFDLLWQREPVDELLASNAISDRLRERLLLAQKIRHFAETELRLPVDDAYSSYSDLGREYVVWNVYAAPELSLQAYTWCYPLLGCMAYRGYFEESRAYAAAKELESEGYEVKVGGVQAYSTLGYFDDPLLNTFLFKQEPGFIELLIHELAHRKLYIQDDTAFNENFATAVGYLGTQQWYAGLGQEAQFNTFNQYKEQFQTLIDFLLGYKDKLLQVYTHSDLTDDQKRMQKQLILDALKTEYHQLKQSLDWDDRYDQWVFSMNNASFATLSNYQQWVPAFIRMFEQQGGDWSRFYQVIEGLAEQEKPLREAALNKLLEPL
jgi:predicted aminopeptidase